MDENWRTRITAAVQTTDGNMRDIAAYVKHLLELKVFHQHALGITIKQKGGLITLSGIPDNALADYQSFVQELQSRSSPDGKISMLHQTKSRRGKHSIEMGFFYPYQDYEILKHSDPQNFRAAIAHQESNLNLSVSNRTQPFP